jgi:ribosomal protein L37E
MSDTPYTNEEIARLGDSAFPQRGVFCPRCRNFIPSFAAFTPEEEGRLRGSGIKGFTELRRKTGCNTVFAKIWWSHPDGPHQAKVTPPCPYCGEPLFTEKTKQCLHCGWDWHDSAKPVQHPVTKKRPNQSPEPSRL